MVYKHAVVAALPMVKMLLKGEVGGRALNSHGNYIVDHGKSWKNHEFQIGFLNYCGDPERSSKVLYISSNRTRYILYFICNIAICFVFFSVQENQVEMIFEVLGIDCMVHTISPLMVPP